MRSDVAATVLGATVGIVASSAAPEGGIFPYLGSGFCIDPRGVIVTCRHVVEMFLHGQKAWQQEDGEDAMQPRTGVDPAAVFFVMQEPGELHFGRIRINNIIAVQDNDVDLAVCSLVPSRDVGAFPFLQPKLGEIWPGMEIGIAGFPATPTLEQVLGVRTPILAQGIIGAIAPFPNAGRHFQLDVTAYHGSSGGPVFCTETGTVLGIVQGSPNFPDDNRGGKPQPIYGIVRADPTLPIFATRMADQILALPVPETAKWSADVRQLIVEMSRQAQHNLDGYAARDGPTNLNSESRSAKWDSAT